MNLDKLIQDSFTRIKYTPREGQIDVIKNVLDAFLVKKKRNVVLCLDTGAGKSIIAAVIAECIQQYESEQLTSFVLMHQNTLLDQYYKSFSTLNEDHFFQVRGASNYSCEYLKYRGNLKNTTAEECQFEHITSIEKDKFCSSCEFKESRKLINRTTHLITNYSYFFISKLWSQHLENRLLHVFDEAHLLNEVFCEHMIIHISSERLDSYIKEIRAETKSKYDDQIFELTKIKMDLEQKCIKESNHESYLERLRAQYSTLKSGFHDLSKNTADLTQKIKYLKISKKYHGLACKISDFLDNEYEHVFDDTMTNEITIKPVFVRDMMNRFLSKYNLFMSATITPKFCNETFGLSSNDSVFITAPSTFPSENRPLLFLGKDALNYTNMQNEKVLANIREGVGRIVNFHKNDKGIILVPSFKLSESISRNIQKNTKVFEHKPKEKLSDLIKAFKEYSGRAVLISPSLFEGLDFQGEHSKFQIIVKTPYASLGDKRIKKILDNYPDVYETMTLFKVLQGIGRSIRSSDDSAVTYFLDKNSSRLFNSKHNMWKERYEVKT